MNQKNPNRGDIAILYRPTISGGEWIEDLRDKHNVKRTDVIRQALAIAAQHQPELERRLASLKSEF